MQKSKLFLIYFLLFSCLFDIITMSIIKSFTSLESNPVYLSIGFWGFITLKMLINIMFVYLFVKYSKFPSNMLSFMTYYLVILFIVAQCMGGIINIISINNIYDEIQLENGNKYNSVFEVSEEDVEKYVATKKESIIYYFTFVFIQIILPIIITMTSFYLWNKNENLF